MYGLEWLIRYLRKSVKSIKYIRNCKVSGHILAFSSSQENPKFFDMLARFLARILIKSKKFLLLRKKTKIPSIG